METWRQIKGIDGYEVSDEGNVRNVASGRLLSTKHPDKLSGYCVVCLKVGSCYKRYVVHRLVANAFLPNPGGKPQVHHINGNKLDNRVSNLLWVTPEEHGKLDDTSAWKEAYHKNKEARSKRALNVLLRMW